MEKIVLGLSGGVDSAVAARLLQQAGWEVHGLYLNNSTPAALAAARESADALGIALEVCEVGAALEALVCRPFTEAYLRGETPNPCILCNPLVKFRALCDFADAIGAEKIATGHYARVIGGALYRARSRKDQSYLLCRIERAQLARLVLPLGDYEKSAVRALAEDFALPAAHRPDSMEICFIPDKDYAGYLAQRGALPPDGDFLWNGAPIGRHGGIHRWTVGQRIPGVYGADGVKLYVRAIDPAANTVAVCEDALLRRSEVRVRALHWLTEPAALPMRGSLKVRHTRAEEPLCTAVADEAADGLRFLPDVPVRAPARGQSAVFYDGDRAVCSGFIL